MAKKKKMKIKVQEKIIIKVSLLFIRLHHGNIKIEEKLDLISFYLQMACLLL